MVELSARKIWSKILGIQVGTLVRPSSKFKLMYSHLWVWVEKDSLKIPCRYFIGRVVKIFLLGKGRRYYHVKWWADRREPSEENNNFYEWDEEWMEVV